MTQVIELITRLHYIVNTMIVDLLMPGGIASVAIV